MAGPASPPDRQVARERGETLLDQVAEHFIDRAGVRTGTMREWVSFAQPAHLESWAAVAPGCPPLCQRTDPVRQPT